MRYGRIRGVAPDVSRCVLGTSGIRDDGKHRLLDAFVAAGGNFLDTARVYGDGTAERCVGDWIRRAKPEGLVILGKGAHPPNCTPDGIAPDLTRTLDTLGVERVDLYMLHRDDTTIPVDEFVDALENEVTRGRIGAYGGSNWTRDRVVAANEYAATLGGNGMVAVSNHFSLAEPAEPLYPGVEHISRTERDYLTQHEIALVPWSSQARGFFADVAPDSLDPNVWRVWGVPNNYARRDRARRMATELGARAINIALAYVLHQPFATFPIIGPRTEEELTLALAGTELELDEGQLRWLEFGDPGRNHAGSANPRTDRRPPD